MKSILLFMLILMRTHAKKKGDDEESKETTDGPVMDRLAKNLAGAFVKSLLPDLEPSGKPVPASQDVRRASSSFESTPNPNYYPPQYPQYHFSNPYGPAATGMYAPNVPLISPQMTQPYPNAALAYPSMSLTYPGTSMPYSASPPNPFTAMGLQPQNGVPFGAEYQPFSINGVTMNKMIGPLTAGNGDIESLNKARNEKYYADLQNHQQDLIQYGKKQMEYLDQQRRYQQAMLDQRAGAALMMQKQHQELLKKRRRALKHLKKLEKQAATKRHQMSENDALRTQRASPESHPENADRETRYDLNPTIRYDQQTGGQVLLTAKEKDPAKQFAARDELDQQFPVNADEEEIVNEEKLKEFFKENYGIDVTEDSQKLTEDERDTLRDLKKHLISEAHGKTLSEGVFKTMTDFKEVMNSEKAGYFNNYNSDAICDKCIPVNITKLKGSWTQVYGNPRILRKTYTTLLSLRNASLKSGRIMTTSLTKRKASCVGLQFGEADYWSSSMRLFFRDDSRLHELYEMSGILKSDGTKLEWDLSGMNMKMCIVRAGPKQTRKYDYIALTEIAGPNKCISYHVYARNSAQFHRKYHDNIADFMKSEVVHGVALPVTGMPKPHLCEIIDDE